MIDDHSRKLPVESDEPKPIASCLALFSPALRVDSTSEATCSRIDRDMRRKLKPALVARTPPLDRSKMVKPIEYSSCRMQRLNVGQANYLLPVESCPDRLPRWRNGDAER
jgi:hypothetical protein